MAQQPPHIAIPLTIDASVAPATGALTHLAGETMGTTWSARFYAGDADPLEIAEAIVTALDTVIAQMSLWQAASDICRFNSSAPGEWQRLPPDFAKVIAAGLEIAAQSDGAFDPALGACTDLWGFGPNGPPQHWPSPAAVTRSKANSGWRHLEWNAGDHMLRRRIALALDLNGIAKGYAVDLVMETVQSFGVTHALIEIGGELKGRGVKADGTPWWVDVDHSHDVAPLRIALHGLAIATSGCERHHKFDGLMVAHTIDPASGSGLDNTVLAISVIHPSCMHADGYATALMVMGVDRALAFATRHSLPALISERRRDGSVALRLSPALSAMLA